MHIIGLDISLDHAGIVSLQSHGNLYSYCALSDVRRYELEDPTHIWPLSKKDKEEPKEVFRLRRVIEYEEYLSKFGIFRKHESKTNQVVTSIEGYAYSSQSTNICQIAELTGNIKRRIFESGGCIRIHDPLSVKLFATNKGNATKKEMVQAAIECGFAIPDGLIKKKNVKKKGKRVEEYDGPATDLADAYFLARMLWTELMVRDGKIDLKDLSEGERRVFLRTTRAYPVNLLDRKFIHKEN